MRVPHKPMSRRQLYIGGSLLFASVYLHYGAATPFMPVWLQSNGFSPEQIGVLLAIPMFIKIVVLAPVANLADVLRRTRDLTWVITATAAALLFSLHYIHGFAAMAIMTALFAVFWDPIPVLTDAYAVSAARDRGLDFGRMRVWASVAVMVSTLGAGWLLYRIGIEWTVWVASGLLAAPLLILPLLPSDKQFEGARRAAKGEWRMLLKDRALLLMIVSVSCVVASHALVHNFSSIQWLRASMSETVVGALWATSVASELVVLWFGRRLLGARSPAVLVIIGAVVATARWGLMAAGVAGPILFLAQMMNGLSIIAPILGMMLFIERRVQPHLIASAQGLYSSAWSAVMAIATLSSGTLWISLDTRAYLVMAALAVLGGAASLIAWRDARRLPTLIEAAITAHKPLTSTHV